ncbi:hypothetical protein [Herbiconiux ginsengi]|uniref:Uncharacterized protein n=1 Tax=Herbiconiux ginsengi TaxID=381665 RepID=A0A1H3LAG1_9MICO|nr:hypothetical protein [Herbiconiux ginsengi]SDY61149.1 hypothetical protein SAMN05216554_0891 [Herbiconiux ginsengi]
MHALAPIDWTASWLIPWAQTPGFGGVAAVLAATIAFAAARYQARVQRAAQRKEQWWKRAESDDPSLRELGLGMLEALSESEWKGEHEDDVIAAAKDRLEVKKSTELISPHVPSLAEGGISDDQSHGPPDIRGDDG